MYSKNLSNPKKNHHVFDKSTEVTLQLPKIKRDPEQTAKLCQCRPICKNRRRKWEGVTLKSSAELLLERKPIPDCFRRQPMNVFPNKPCPLFAKSKKLVIKELHVEPKPAHVIRICQAPLDDKIDTPYLRFAEMAVKLGAWEAVRACCAFCSCKPCCPCGVREYVLHNEEQAQRCRADRRAFDARVKEDYKVMRIMYDKPII